MRSLSRLSSGCDVSSSIGRTVLLLLAVLVSLPGWAQHPIVTFSEGAPADPFNGPQFPVFDAGGNLFVSDSNNHRVQRIDKLTGAVTTVVGTGTAGSTGDGGPGINAQLNCPAGLAFGRNGHLLIADPCAQVVRTVAPSATDGFIQGRADETITLFAGGGSSTAGPGVGPTALGLAGPSFLAVDANDSVYIGPGDSSDVSIIGVDTSGNTWVVAEYSWINPLSLGVDKLGFVMAGGDGDDWPLLSCIDPTTASPYNQTPIVGNPNGSGFRMDSSVGIAFDSAGNLYTDLFSRHSIVKLNAPAGPCGYNGNQFTTYVGTGDPGFTGDGGAATEATLNTPTGLVFNSAGNLFIADTVNNAIRAVLAGATTGTGSPVAVNPLDANGSPRSDVTITFDDVTTAGETALFTGQNPFALPPNFGLSGTPPQFYDIVTTAQFSGNVTVCIADDPVPAGARLFHHDATGWVDVTIDPAPPQGPICGLVTSLSPFAVVVPFHQNQPPAITNANAATFRVGEPGAFTVTTTGTPTPAITAAGALPTGVGFVDNGNGTATLSGTPATGTGGTYPLTFTATNGVSPDATQSFVLTVIQAPAITTANSATFATGVAGSFTVTATGFPTPVLTESGTLPGGVTFVDNHNGTAAISGIPSTSGTFILTLTASNGVASDATQTFTLNVSGGSGAALMVTPTTVNFGNIERFHLAASRVTLQNTGPSSVTVGKVSLTLGAHADWDDFFFLNLCPTKLDAGKSCGIYVYFFADDSGTANATLNIPNSAANSPQSVSLTGTGVNK